MEVRSLMRAASITDIMTPRRPGQQKLQHSWGLPASQTSWDHEGLDNRNYNTHESCQHHRHHDTAKAWTTETITLVRAASITDIMTPRRPGQQKLQHSWELPASQTPWHDEGLDNRKYNTHEGCQHHRHHETTKAWTTETTTLMRAASITDIMTPRRPGQQKLQHSWELPAITDTMTRWRPGQQKIQHSWGLPASQTPWDHEGLDNRNYNTHEGCQHHRHHDTTEAWTTETTTLMRATSITDIMTPRRPGQQKLQHSRELPASQTSWHHEGLDNKNYNTHEGCQHHRHHDPTKAWTTETTTLMRAASITDIMTPRRPGQQKLQHSWGLPASQTSWHYEGLDNIKYNAHENCQHHRHHDTTKAWTT